MGRTQHARRWGLSAAEKRELWERWRRGQWTNEIARALGKLRGSIYKVLASSGGGGPDEVRFTVRGERGALRLENWHQLLRFSDGAWVEEPVPIAPHPDGRTASFQAQLDVLARLARGQAHGLPDAATGLAVQRVIETILRSH